MSSQAADGGRFFALIAWAERRLPALTRLKRPESLPLTLDRKRLYVLPTGAGLFIGALVIGMLLGALNYNNNPALLLSFLVASAVHSSLLQGYFNLLGLRILQLDAEPAHAGEQIRLLLRVHNPDSRQRRGLCFRLAGHVSSLFLGPQQSGHVALAVTATRRGYQRCGRIAVFTRHPLGLFRVWSWISPDRKLLVYPAIEREGPPLPLPSTDGNRRWRRAPGEQLHSLRDYRVGDPLRLMAWKRSAQAGRPLVREFEAPTGGQVELDWQALDGVDNETRISRLTRWLCEAERQGLKTRLVLPGQVFGPDRGDNHRRNCLTALALLPGAADGDEP
ncbi:MAG: DUF58 domain-containing protein [Xanthomonadales bacterium]|nr:DUF58 domain-containing protein [Xanthomonadales bacterium]